MKSGRHNEYFWIQWEDASIPMLLSRVPTIILGRYLINTSFDSGSLTLSDKERQSGWRSVGSLT